MLKGAERFGDRPRAEHGERDRPELLMTAQGSGGRRSTEVEQSSWPPPYGTIETVGLGAHTFLKSFNDRFAHGTRPGGHVGVK